MPLRSLLEFDAAGRPFLPAREIHHLTRVRRLQEGDRFLGLHRAGARWYECRLVTVEGQRTVEVLSCLGNLAESPLEIILGAALVKRARFEWMIQKACELGVSEIVPLQTRYVQEKVTREVARRRERWERILEESIKQSGRSRAPRLGVQAHPAAFLEGCPEALRLAFDSSGDGDLLAIRNESAGGPPHGCVAVLIGPEGGWSVEEIEGFQESGTKIVSLGPRVLRAETAAVAALALVQCLWGDLSPGQEPPWSPGPIN